MLGVICIIVTFLIVVIIITIVLLEYREENKVSKRFQQEDVMKKLNEIYDLDDEGLCSSCAYGKDKCLDDCQAHCKLNDVDTNKKENKNG